MTSLYLFDILIPPDASVSPPLYLLSLCPQKAIYSLFPLAGENVGLSLAVSLISGMTAGVAAAVVSHPFDTLTTKVRASPFSP